MKPFKDKLVGYIGKEPIIGTLEEGSFQNIYRLILTCMDKEVTCLLLSNERDDRLEYMYTSYVQDLALMCLDFDAKIITNTLKERGI